MFTETDLVYEFVEPAMAQQWQYQQAAEQIAEWLATSPGTLDKPVDEILDESNGGMLVFLADEDGEPNWQVGPVAYVAQRKINDQATVVWPDSVFDGKTVPPIYEVSSFIVGPEFRGRHIGSATLNKYLQEGFGSAPDKSLTVALANGNSTALFLANGFVVQTQLPPQATLGLIDSPEQYAAFKALQQRVAAAQTCGKVLVGAYKSVPEAKVNIN